jgi:hypothetical protein
LKRRLIDILLIAVVLYSTSGCAARLQPPIVQAWTAVLVHDDRVVFETTVTALDALMYLRQCPTTGGLRRITTGYRCRMRWFRFWSLDRQARIAIYRELAS